jgi:hypothetical protein
MIKYLIFRYVHEIDDKNNIIWVEFYEAGIGSIARYRAKFQPKNASKTAVPIYMWKNSVSFHLNGKKKRGPMVNQRNQFPIFQHTLLQYTNHRQGLAKLYKKCVLLFE